MNNKVLMIVAVVLMAISIFSYTRSTARAERFERGQKFLSQLNTDNIHEVEINKGEDKVVLRKSDDKFLVVSKHNYPAKNESINRFLNDTLNIELEKTVGSGDSLAEELEITGGEKTLNIVLRNDAGKDMVQFTVGKASDDGRGNYVKRTDGEDQEIYLTSKGVYLSSDGDNFLDKEILDVAEGEISRIQGKDFVIEEADGALKLQGVPSGKKESSDVSQVKGMLKGLSFDKVYLADDAVVSALKFTSPVRVDLKDHSGYLVSMSKSGEKHFLKIQGTYDMSQLEGITVNPDDTEEQLKEKSALLNRRDAIQDFNNFHGSWVYELTEYQAKKFTKAKADLLEDEAEE